MVRIITSALPRLLPCLAAVRVVTSGGFAAFLAVDRDFSAYNGASPLPQPLLEIAMIEHASNIQASDEDCVRKRMNISLREIGIPPRPTILKTIEQEMAREEPDLNRLANLLRSDVALAAGLIKTANSPMLGLSKKVASPREAILLLGLRHVIQVIAGLSLRQVFGHLPDMERFWDSSARIAEIAAWLCAHLLPRGELLPEDAHTFALFRDAGIPSLIIHIDDYRALLAVANTEAEIGFTEVERQEIGIDHAQIGARLAQEWLLPETLAIAIAHHHERPALLGQLRETLPPSVPQLIALAQLAEYIFQIRTGLAMTCEWKKLGSACLSLLGLQPENIGELVRLSREAAVGN